MYSVWLNIYRLKLNNIYYEHYFFSILLFLITLAYNKYTYILYYNRM
jgi:hypothetical protein